MKMELLSRKYPRKCKYCENPATKLVRWADRRAAVAVCDTHLLKVEEVIIVDNKDKIDVIEEYPMSSALKLDCVSVAIQLLASARLMGSESLAEFAREELNKAGLFDKDSDYGGLVAHSVMELIERLSKQGHSGYSAHMVLDLFDKLSNHKIITPCEHKSKTDPTGEGWMICDHCHKVWNPEGSELKSKTERSFHKSTS
jgi:hypothetical protein